MITRTTRITIETERTLVVRQGRTIVTWCPECRMEVEVMLLDSGCSPEDLLSPLGSMNLHVWTPEGGDARVCLPSLLAYGAPGEIKTNSYVEPILPAPGSLLAAKGE